MNVGDKHEVPKGAMPFWYINDEQRLRCLRDSKPFADYTTSDYFAITKQIDSTIVQGFIGRTDSNSYWLNTTNASLTYLIDYHSRKAVYFSFDKISLYQLVEIQHNGSDPLTFTLKRIATASYTKPNTAFMIMPFHNPELNDFYIGAIKPFLKSKCQTDIFRADDFRNNDIIVETIYRLIEESEIIIADTTFENKNAFYELGYASAKEKEVITIQNRNVEQRLFFDRAHIRSILYDPNDLDSFFFDLEATICGIRSRQ